MKRLEVISKYVGGVIAGIPDERGRRHAYAHLYGVSQAASLLAAKRGLDPGLAAVSGLLHDIYAYAADFRKYHSHNSAEAARPILRETELFTPEEEVLILSAVFHHSDKSHVHDGYDEVIKDADVLSPYLNGDIPEESPERTARLGKTLRELGLKRQAAAIWQAGAGSGPAAGPGTAAPEPAGGRKHGAPHGRRARLADIAGLLARKPVTGSADDAGFLKIAKHWPDTQKETAVSELTGAWCAAFAYHCCIEAGFVLPIRYPGTSCRFAAVSAWYEWAVRPEVDLFIPCGAGFIPERGDIVIYDNIISPDRKPADSGRLDHIGIVLSYEGGRLTVAEGNADNGNRSAVIKRNMHEKIRGYIRINDEYEYEGWKFDYKTGALRTEPYI